MANPSPDKGNAPMEDQRTYMTDEQAERWAWEQVKRDVGTEGWTAGESCTYYGFFLWGWRYKGQYQRQRVTPPLPSTAPEHSQFVNCENAAAFKAPFNAVDERAAFEAWAVTAGPWDGPLQWGRHSNGEYKHPGIEGDWKVWQARAALASRPAEVDDEGLPPEPESKFCTWLKHGQVVNVFPHGVGDKERWDHDGYWSKKGFHREPLFTAEQYRQGQRDAVAADRARRSKAGTPQIAQDWRALGYVEGATVRQEIGLGRYDDAVITHADRNGALDVEINGRAYGWSARFCKVVSAAAAKKATD